MGYSETIKKQARNAFRLVGNLAENLELQQKDATGFNFATQQTVETTVATKIVKCLPVKRTRDPNKEPNTITKTVMFLSEDVSDLTCYDKVVYQGFTWSISLPSIDDGYTTTISLKREG